MDLIFLGIAASNTMYHSASHIGCIAAYIILDSLITAQLQVLNSYIAKVKYTYRIFMKVTRA